MIYNIEEATEEQLLAALARKRAQADSGISQINTRRDRYQEYCADIEVLLKSKSDRWDPIDFIGWIRASTRHESQSADKTNVRRKLAASFRKIADELDHNDLSHVTFSNVRTTSKEKPA